MDQPALTGMMEILLVEDNLEDARLTMQALKQKNVHCRVHLVCDGDEALGFLCTPRACSPGPRCRIWSCSTWSCPRQRTRCALGHSGRAAATKHPRHRPDGLGGPQGRSPGSRPSRRRLYDQACELGAIHRRGQVIAAVVVGGVGAASDAITSSPLTNQEPQEESCRRGHDNLLTAADGNEFGALG